MDFQLEDSSLQFVVQGRCACCHRDAPLHSTEEKEGLGTSHSHGTLKKIHV